MIESRLDPRLDGAGGGYGRYPGLTTVQIAERFRYLVEEGQGRSARAILRIVHEQTEARGKLGTQRVLVAMGVAITAFLAAFRLVVAPETRDGLTRLILASAAITLVFAIGVATMHQATVRADAQVREIRRLALESLDLLVSQEGFKPASLEREHRASLAELKKADPAAWTRVSQGLNPEA